MARIGGGNNTRNHIAQIMNTHPLLRMCHFLKSSYQNIFLINLNE